MNLEWRMINVQSWWLASELVRRHPQLGLIETHPGGGMYDCLTIVKWGHDAPSFIDLNRQGRVHVHPDHLGIFTWQDDRAQDDRHWGVKEVERFAQLKPPSKTPSTNKVSMTLRVLYNILLLTLNARPTWDVRNARIDTAGLSFSTGNVDGFRTAQIGAQQCRPDDPYGDPLYRFWRIQRDAESLAVLDIDGMLHRPDADATDLMPLFEAEGRSPARVAAKLVSEFGKG